MKNLRLLVACTAIFALFFAVSCSDDGGDPSETNCTDGQDNDGDGVADCQDSDCAAHPNCQSACNFNSLCEPALNENATNCTDCQTTTFCGDGTCDLDENATSCPADCGTGPYCGDGTCDAGETASSCPADCSGGDTCDSPASLIDQVGCLAGEMCTIISAANDIGCGPEGTVADYAECSQTLGDCLAGALCAGTGSGDTCMPFCDLTGGTCPGGGICAFSFPTAQGDVGLCTPPDNCDLVDATGCDAGEGCYVASQAGDTLCTAPGSVAVGAACTYTNDCGIGVGCIGSVCVELCHLDGDCTTGTCLNIGSVATGHTDVGSCG